jgi:hypothetical protein
LEFDERSRWLKEAFFFATSEMLKECEKMAMEDSPWISKIQAYIKTRQHPHAK